ncbi:hypothetical protein L195_g046134 [Trifolium pratense]|uniref:Endonuclease/exonuclease/phosphatase domain-containing protein n=1 Tax=Trifolium pratense TaxID=57577 RepID=A0A2K3MGW1_TRIPR|nr:hypothetical protein L195_g046134 [Trifolium pratense]
MIIVTLSIKCNKMRKLLRMLWMQKGKATVWRNKPNMGRRPWSRSLRVLDVFFLKLAFMKNIASWNVRGAGSRSFPTMIRDFCSINHVDVLVIIAPRISGDVADKVIKRLGFPNHFKVDAVGFSGGIWMLWSDSTVKVDVIMSNSQLIRVQFSQVVGGSWNFSCIYGSPRSGERTLLWNTLQSISDSMDKPWLVMGDFNAYLSVEDKQGGFHGPRFMWEGRGIKERIDLALCNRSWQTTFPEANNFHLPALKLDHRPIIVRLSPTQLSPTNRPFRFMANWIPHENFSDLVKEVWAANDEWKPNGSRIPK